MTELKDLKGELQFCGFKVVFTGRKMKYVDQWRLERDWDAELRTPLRKRFGETERYNWVCRRVLVPVEGDNNKEARDD